MIRIFDTGEAYADRYTVIIGKSMYTMSKDALSPGGVNMYCCEVPADYESNNVEIDIKDLSQDVKWAILDRVKAHI